LGIGRSVCRGQAALVAPLSGPATRGAPSRNTFSRVFAALDPTQVQQALLSWVQMVQIATTGGEVVAIDGKVMRGSADKAWGRAAIRIGQRLGEGQPVGAGPAAGRRRLEQADGGSGAARTAGADRLHRPPGREALPDRDG